MSEMHMPKTAAALDQLMAESRFGNGTHMDETVVSGCVDLQFGAEQFDPSHHDILDADVTLYETETQGGLWVPNGLSNRPIHVNVVEDRLHRNDSDLFNAQKMSASKNLANGIAAAVPQLDTSTGVTVTDVIVDRYDFSNVVEVDTREEGVRYIEQVALSGLTFVVSDFKFDRFEPGSMNGFVALKIAQTVEPGNIPRNVGPLELGPNQYLDTNNKRDVKRYNDIARRRHEESSEALEQAGAHVIQVEANSNKFGETSFSVPKVDEDLATVITNMR